LVPSQGKALVILFYTFKNALTSVTQRFDTNLSTQVQSLLDEATSNLSHGIPGVVFTTIDRSGTRLTANASGVRDLRENIPMTLDTIFYLGSCTKLVTTIGALQLVERGKLHFDDPE
jgi:CubicO group peptidase (beta-lactamase class C family)